MKYCNRCGAQNDDEIVFCTKCGSRFSSSASQETQQYRGAQSQPASPYGQPPYGMSVQRKSKKGVFIAGIVALVLAAAVLVAVFVIIPGLEPALPAIAYTYQTQEKDIVVDYVSTDIIYPNLYSTMDSVINLTATSEGGDSNVMVKAEVVGFTQPYEQKVELSEQITQLFIKPAVLAGDLDLWTSKDAQFKLFGYGPGYRRDHCTGFKNDQADEHLRFHSLGGRIWRIQP